VSTNAKGTFDASGDRHFGFTTATLFQAISFADWSKDRKRTMDRSSALAWRLPEDVVLGLLRAAFSPPARRFGLTRWNQRRRVWVVWVVVTDVRGRLLRVVIPNIVDEDVVCSVCVGV
jgi:hypothetical protein